MLEKIFIPQVYLPIIYICVAIIINGIFKRLISHIISSKQEKLNKNSYNYKKAETFRTFLINISKYFIIIFLILAILTIYGVDVSSALAGLGILGIVVGLALQDLAKDIISGVSIIFENQYAVGDIISIGDFVGEVIFLGLKTTKIKSWDGKVKILSNRNITEVINYSMESSIAIVDVNVSYEDDIEKVEKVLNDLAEKLNQSLPNLKGKVESLGIDDLADSSVVFRIIAPTIPTEKANISRLIRKEVKLCLDQNKITIPYPQIEVHNGRK